MASPPRTVSTYRLFWTNAAGRITSAAQAIEAESDQEAVRLAGALSHGRPVEVWIGTHRVAALNSAGRSY